MTDSRSLPDIFFELLQCTVTEVGFPLSPVLALDVNGEMTVTMLAAPCHKVFQIVTETIISDLKNREIIFGIDCNTKPDQGTKYADVVLIFWWQRERPGDYGFRFGVVNYKPLPDVLLIEPIDWNNTFWTDVMSREVNGFQDYMEKTVQRILGRSEENIPEQGIGIDWAKARALAYLDGPKPSVNKALASMLSDLMKIPDGPEVSPDQRKAALEVALSRDVAQVRTWIESF